MRNILTSCFLLFGVSAFGQTPITSIQIDTFYLSGILNGQYQIFKASEFVGAGGGGTDDQTLAEVLTSGNTANIDIDMNTNDLTNAGSLEVDISGTTIEGLRINGIASQTSDYIHIQDNSAASVFEINSDKTATLGAYGSGTLASAPLQLTGFISGGTITEFDFADLTDGGAFFGSGDKIIFWNGTAFRSADYDDLPAGGGGDNLGNHTATASLNLNNNEIDSASVITLFNTDADGDTWSFLEKGTTGNIWIQSSEAATADLELTTAGQLILPEYGSTGLTGTATKWLAVDASGNVIQEAPPAGAVGSYFMGICTTAVAIDSAANWEYIPFHTDVELGADFTHSASSNVIGIANTGLYRVSASAVFVTGTNRQEVYIRVLINGAQIPGAFGYEAGTPFTTASFDPAVADVGGVIFNATASDIIQVQVRVNAATDWTLDGANTFISMERLE